MNLRIVTKKGRYGIQRKGWFFWKWCYWSDGSFISTEAQIHEGIKTTRVFLDAADVLVRLTNQGILPKPKWEVVTCVD